MSPTDQKKLLADVEAFCQEIRPIEELCYAEHQFNDQVVPLARKHNILGMLTPPELGGRGADAVTYSARPGPDRPRRNGRPHFFLRPRFHRLVPDIDLGHGRAEATLSPGRGPRRKGDGVRPDRARRRQQSA